MQLKMDPIYICTVISFSIYKYTFLLHFLKMQAENTIQLDLPVDRIKSKKITSLKVIFLNNAQSMT